MSKNYYYIFQFFLFVLVVPDCLSQGLSRIDSLKMELIRSESPESKSAIYNQLANAYKISDNEKAIENASEAYKISSEINDPLQMAKSLNIIADIERQNANYKEALYHAKRADSIADRYSYKEEKFVALKTLGYVSIYLGNYETCLHYFFRCKKLAEEINNNKLISSAYSCIGYANYRQQYYEDALDYYMKAMSISNEINDREGIARELNNFAAVYAGMGQWDNFQKYVKEAVGINMQTGNKYWLMINYLNLGALFNQLGENDSSLYYSRKAYQLAAELDNVARMAMIEINMGTSYFNKTSKTDSSYIYAYKAWNLAREKSLTKESHKAAELLLKLYTHDSEQDSSIKYMRLMYMLKDSMAIERNAATLTKLELKYALEKEELNKLSEQKQTRIIYLLILGGFITVVIVLIFIGYRSRMRTKIIKLENLKLENELTAKNKEITTNVMAVMKRKEKLLDVASKLIDLQKIAVKDETKDILDKLAEEINKAFEDDIWEEFEVVFNSIHEDFTANLKKNFPDLTPNDLRLCALLRLNLSNKEISQLTGTSLKALETARYRLRKRLNISDQRQSLATFLMDY